MTCLAESITVFINSMTEDEENEDDECEEGMVKRRRIKYIALPAAFFLVIYLCRGCCDALFVASREVYPSPKGTNTIIIEYDHVCRPYVYQKTWYGKREIWTYPSGGFMETVSFSVEWLSEDKFRTTYDDKDDEFDEEYIITIPK